MFDVSEVDVTLDHLKLKIDDIDFTEKFVKLAHRLEKLQLIGRVVRSKEGNYIYIARLPAQKKNWMSNPWIPRLLFGIVVTFVMIDGYFRTEGLNTLINFGDPLEMAGLYTLSLLGILGIHESGHIIAAKMHKLKTSWPYFIPGIPVFGFIPTFGAVIFQPRGMTINRKILFDVAIAGPIAGLVIAIIVSIFASYTAPVIDDELANELYEKSQLIEWELGEPLFMKGTLAMFGKSGDENEVLMTPILFAAWIGFLVTFLNLLPAWQLDGGHIARSIFGAKWHRIATFASIGVLIWPLNYWFMALFILMLSSRNPGAQPLDDISTLPKGRKALYILVIILAILCAPLPSSLSI
jgi:membrane-associated protease RseP (regulator of RpoE activity)